eukprot:m.111440 g.111440  ORF g.111440 m.111440 type:complete len:135 (+) comp12764_c1_seq2:120-524(+)
MEVVVEAIKNAKKISFLTGAGVSVFAGIPDFRSPGGMYDTLRPELLTATTEQREMMETEPTTVVSWDLFEDNQLPYLELRRPFILQTLQHHWKPTIAHHFMDICNKHGVFVLFLPFLVCCFCFYIFSLFLFYIK